MKIRYPWIVTRQQTLLFIWIEPEGRMKISELKTPCYVIDEGKLTENLKILHHVMQRTGAKILLAQKAFSAFCCLLYTSDAADE